jgi:hypothetical protein
MAVGQRGSFRANYVSEIGSNFPNKMIEANQLKALLHNGIFICGHPKSGTSLVMTMLDSHPQLLVYPEESHYFRRFLPTLLKKGQMHSIEIAKKKLIHMFSWDPNNPAPHQSGFLDRDYSSIDQAKIAETFAEIVSQLGNQKHVFLPAAIMSYGLISGQWLPTVRCWVEKTPYNERYVDEMFELWEDVKCIHVVRDPRDNFASYSRKKEKWSLNEFAYSWRESLKRGRENQKRYGESRYLVCRYEDIVENTEEFIAQLVAFLDILDNATLRVPTRAGKSWAGNSMFGDQFVQISTKPSGRYQQYLTKEAIAVLEHLLRPEMEYLGYAFERPVSFTHTLVSRARRLRWDWR